MEDFSQEGFSLVGNGSVPKDDGFQLVAIAAKGWIPKPPANLEVPIPPAPLLKDGMDEDEMVNYLKHCYNAVQKHKQLKGMYARRDRDQDDKYILEAGYELQALKLRPITWIEWTCDSWNHNRDKAVSPPLRYTFSVSRIQERKGWFKSDSKRYRSTQVRLYFSPEASATCKAWSQFQQALILERPASQEACAQILARFFPRGYDAELQEAKAAQEFFRADLQDRLARFQYVW